MRAPRGLRPDWRLVTASLLGFFLQLQRQLGTFPYIDPDDNSIIGQVFASCSAQSALHPSAGSDAATASDANANLGWWGASAEL